METPLYLVIRNITSHLTPAYGQGEAKAMARIIFENLKGWTPVDLAIRANEPISDFILQKIDAILTRLDNHEPIQYIFGNANFYGMKLKVTPDTLIPRPETAELVDIIVKDNGNRKDLRVVDFGTGSGCIALALARNLPFSSVTAVDISDKALAVARENAKNLHANIQFINADILNLSASPLANEQFDIIVSNPPYIAQNESASMDANVLDYEPHAALFVPDDDPLRFYRAILQYAEKAIAPGGHIYFEINPLFANQLLELTRSLGFSSATLSRDTSSRLRFLSASR